MKPQETNFFCNLDVLSEQERQQFAATTDSILAAVQEMRELENGFAFRFRNQPGQRAQIADFIQREGQCCSFLRFKLEVEPATGPTWLSITGPEGVKDFLRAELGHIQNEDGA